MSKALKSVPNVNRPPSYTVYPFQPSNDGAYTAPLPPITCHDLAAAMTQAETFTDADIVVCYPEGKQLVARRVNNAWIQKVI